MSSSHLLRKTKPVNVREAQAQLSKLIRSKFPSMVLSHGKPVSFLVPYEDMLDLVETPDELKDKRLLGEIERARAEYAQGESRLCRTHLQEVGAVVVVRSRLPE